MRESDADKRQVPEWVGRLVLLAFCIFLTVLAVNADNPVGTLSYGGLAAVLWIFLILFVWGSIQKRRIAGVMREARSSGASVQAEQLADSDTSVADRQGPLRFELYREKELPPLSFQYVSNVTAGANILGQAPKRVLYLYNFYSFTAQTDEVEGLFRRFGPVYFLGSPATESMTHMFDVRVKENLVSEMLVTPERIDSFLQSSSEEPFPPGNKSVGNQPSYLTGGYPQYSLLCSDGSWQYAVKRLFEIADTVVIDAAGYTPERGGLNWELGYVVNHVPTERILALIDEQTHAKALSDQFSKAWLEMGSGSPNNRPAAGPVRFVHVKSEEEIRNEIEKRNAQGSPVGPPPDPANVLTQLSSHHRKSLTLKYETCVFSERIFGLLL
jgi:hypothetical protein